MGAGKTTVGRLLARRLRRPFADVDAEIERRAGARCARSSSATARPAFRALEETVTRELLARGDAPVIALGGGALVVRRDARARCASTRFCAWLDVAVRDRPGSASAARPARAR